MIESNIIDNRASFADAKARAAILMPGHNHLQKAYVVKRNGRRVPVPTSRCTRAELLAIADRLRGSAHEAELREYLEVAS